MVNGYDSYFYVQYVQGEWLNLFLNPDALSMNKVDAHEDYLKTACRYAAGNLDALRRLLINMCSSELIQETNVYVEHTDGGVIILNWTLL